MPCNMPSMEVASSRVWAPDTNIHVRGEGGMTTLPPPPPASTPHLTFHSTVNSKGGSLSTIHRPGQS